MPEPYLGCGIQWPSPKLQRHFQCLWLEKAQLMWLWAHGVLPGTVTTGEALAFMNLVFQWEEHRSGCLKS